MKTFTPKDRSEVDIRVAQEIKNHQDLMYQTGQQIQTLSSHLVSLSVQHEKVLAKSESDRKEILIAFENLQENVLQKLDKFFQRIGDLEARCMQIQLDYGDKLYEFSKSYATKEEHVKACALLWGKFKELDDKVKSERNFDDTEFSKVRSQIKDWVADIRKEIPSVEEFKPLKKEMEDTFLAFKVDFVGLVKEIALLKKAVAYDQKKFENVYTLIERLKEGNKCQQE